eukprot:541401_1
MIFLSLSQKKLQNIFVNVTQEPLLKHDGYPIPMNVLNEEIPIEHGNKLAVCCLCCTDLVTPMSKQERIIKLTYGYIRNNCKYQIPSDILYQLVLQFIGDVNNFDGRQLMTDKEIRDEQQKCLDFITDTFCFRRYSGWSDVFCKLGSEIFCLILFISVFIGKDIACIIINDQNQCNH